MPSIPAWAGGPNTPTDTPTISPTHTFTSTRTWTISPTFSASPSFTPSFTPLPTPNGLHVNPWCIIDHVAGVYTVPGYSGDGGPAAAARTNLPQDVAFDSLGNLYFSDTSNHQIRRIDLAGNISRYAGLLTGGVPTSGYNGDGIPATSAALNGPQGIAFDPADNLYIADKYNHRIRRVDRSTGLISTYIGSGVNGLSIDGAPYGAAINYPLDVDFDPFGRLYFLENSRRVRRASGGQVFTYAGSIPTGYAGDGGPAVGALIFSLSMAFHPSGELYLCDGFNHCIRRIDSSGTISTVFGTGVAGSGGVGGPGTFTQVSQPTGVGFDPYGEMYVADQFNLRILKMDGSGNSQLLAGGGSGEADGGPAVASGTGNGYGFAFNSSGDLYYCSTACYTVRKIYACGPAPTATVTLSSTPTRTISPTFSHSPTATATATASPTRTASPSASPSPTRTGTRTATGTRTGTATRTATVTASPTRTPSSSASPTPSLSPTLTGTPPPGSSATSTSTISATWTATGSPSATEAPTATESATATPTDQDSPSATPLDTSTLTSTPSPSIPSATTTVTATPSPALPTATSTQTVTPSPALPTATTTQTATPSPALPTATTTQTATPSPALPSATSTQTATPSPALPTATSTQTATPSPALPSATSTQTVTPSPALPSATSTQTATPSPVLPSSTATPTSAAPTATFTSSSTPAAAASATNTPLPGAPPASSTPPPGDGPPRLLDLAVDPNPVQAGQATLRFKLEGRADDLEVSIYSPGLGVVQRHKVPAAAGPCWCQARLVLSGLPNGVWFVRLRAASGSGSSARTARFFVAR